MSKDTVPVEVQVFDKTYKVACPEEEREDLLASALQLDERMRATRTTGRVVGSERIAVITALNVTHELLRLQAMGGSQQPVSSSRLRELADRIDDALSTESPTAV
jgi:cell division protein ZapA